MTRVTLPSSASKMIATVPALPFSRLRSRQLYEALSSPSSNHGRTARCDSSSTCVNGLCHSSVSRARSPQKPSKSRAPGRSSRRRSAVFTFACASTPATARRRASRAGRTRWSTSDVPPGAESVRSRPVADVAGTLRSLPNATAPLPTPDAAADAMLDFDRTMTHDRAGRPRSRASPTRCSTSPTTTRPTTSRRWARRTRRRSRRPRGTRSRRSSPIRACAPRATGRSARTPASSWRS